GMSTLAALAGLTSRIRLGLLVAGVTYRHPSVFAAEALTIDHASHGRLELSLGAAWFDKEHDELGIPFPSTGARFDLLEDALAIAAGRDPSAIMRANSLSLDDLDTARKHAGKWVDAGYGYLICGWPDAGRSQVEGFARDVMPEFTG